MGGVGAHIYFIRAGDDGPIKIGIANEPTERLKALSTMNHSPLAILATFPGTHKDEARLHRTLKDERRGGEWFEPSERVLALVALYSGKRGKAWESAVDMEPRLARVIESMCDEEGRYHKYCATETWERKYKPALQSLIGWAPEHHLLRTARFYDLAHAKAVNALPAASVKRGLTVRSRMN